LALSAGLDAALGSVASSSSLGAGFDGGTAMTSHTSNARRISSINTVRSRIALMKSRAQQKEPAAARVSQTPRLFAQPLFMRRGRFRQSDNRRSPPSEFNVVDVCWKPTGKKRTTG